MAAATGPDGTIWGGEFLRIDPAGSDEPAFERLAHLRCFRLPGSESAVKQPRRSATGLLCEMLGPTVFDRDDLAPVQAFALQERKVLRTMLEGTVNSPLTSSAGRLFDAVSSIMGLRQSVRFEGQAAMELEFLATGVECDENYSVTLRGSSPLIVDWEEMMLEIMSDLLSSVSTAIIARKFHNTMAEMMVAVAHRVGCERIALTGGCFQNKLLTERAVRRLQQEGFRVYWHQRVPPNDGGIALGQVMAVVRATFVKPKE